MRGIHHHRHRTAGVVERDRPRPAVGVRLNQRVRGVGQPPAVRPRPHRGERDRAVPLFQPAPGTRPCQQTCPARAVQAHRRRTLRRFRRRQHRALDAHARFLRGRQHHPFERRGRRLPSRGAVREHLHPRVTRAPPHGVTGGANKAGIVDRRMDAEQVEELPTARASATRRAALPGAPPVSSRGSPCGPTSPAAARRCTRRDRRRARERQGDRRARLLNICAFDLR